MERVEKQPNDRINIFEGEKSSDVSGAFNVMKKNYRFMTPST